MVDIVQGQLTVPDVSYAGLDYETAVAMGTEAYFAVELLEEEHPTVPYDEVTRQDPLPGLLVDAVDQDTPPKLTIWRSKGHARDVVGSVAATLTPAALMEHRDVITIGGNVSFQLLIASLQGRAGIRQIVGNIQHSLTPNALLEHRDVHTLAGAVTLSLIPGSQMGYKVSGTLTGNVRWTLTPGSTMGRVRNASIEGNVAHSLQPASLMQYVPASSGGHAMVGRVSYSLTPSSSMSYQAGGLSTIAFKQLESGFVHVRYRSTNEAPVYDCLIL